MKIVIADDVLNFINNDQQDINNIIETVDEDLDDYFEHNDYEDGWPIAVTYNDKYYIQFVKENDDSDNIVKVIGISYNNIEELKEEKRKALSK